MDLPSQASTDSGPNAELTLTIARSRNVQTVVRQAAIGIAAHAEVAHCRIWLVRPGDICQNCALRDQYADQTECLHLVVNEGDPGADDTRRQLAPFQRVPIGVELLGRTVRSSTAGRVADLSLAPRARLSRREPVSTMNSSAEMRVGCFRNPRFGATSEKICSVR